jgi:hypothetical protein
MRALATAFLVAFFIVFSFLGIGSWSCNQPPKPNGEPEHSDEAKHENCATPYGTVIVGLHDAGGFVKGFHDEITAVSTVVIAIFTIVLGVFTVSLSGSTRIAAEAAKDSADALTQSERAQLFVIIQNQSIEGLIVPIRRSIQTNECRDENEIVRQNRETTVQCVFKNYGKTPAIVKEINLRLAYHESLPTEPVYIPRDTVLSEFMIAGGDETDTQQCELEGTLTTAQAYRVVRAQNYIWFYGRVVYDDIFGREHQHRFLWRYGGARGFRPNYEHPQYIQNT